MEAGIKSETGRCGAYDYTYETKENALGWMNYIIGYIKYYHLNEKETALSYFHKSLEYKSEVEKFAETMPFSKK